MIDLQGISCTDSLLKRTYTFNDQCQVLLKKNSWTLEAVSKVFLHLLFPLSDFCGQRPWSLSEYYWSCGLACVFRPELECCIYVHLGRMFFVHTVFALWSISRVVLLSHWTNMNDSTASRWFWGEACQLYTKCPLSFQDLLFLLWGEFNLPILVNVNKTNWNRDATISETRCVLDWYFVHVCHDSCSVCGRNRLRCCRSWPIAQHLYIPSPEGMKLPLTTTMAPRFATIDTS